MNGKIIKALAGFYYVASDKNRIYECRAKGAFRNENITPLVGDDVKFDVISENDRTGNVTEILPRRNSLFRPAVANVDQAMVVFAVRSPFPNLSILDRFLLLMKKQGIETIIVFNKKDLAKSDDIKNLKNTYKKSGHKVYFISAGGERPSLSGLKMQLRGKITVMAGPSGVGKSTILNTLSRVGNEEVAQVGAISSKAGRGKHTTRHNEIYTIGRSYHIVDTPGFTSLLVSADDVTKEELGSLFPEFSPYASKCPFKDCSHIKERDCAVRKAVEDGKIAQSRYNSYKAIYEEVKSQKKY
ncbi:MAG: ribosome small subunit-dependent GTPase A [Parasporobacterium sp.]|nr:ribosome small subunit-dependent GTPase A [Parasporobacterium sp.]